MMNWAGGILLASLLLWISWIDFKQQIIPNLLNAMLLVSGIAVTYTSSDVSPLRLLGECTATLVIFLLLAFAYKRIRHRTGLGMGDIKFLTAATAWVGIAYIPFVILIASISGLATVILFQMSGRQLLATTRLAFGPHLSLALMVVWLQTNALGFGF